MAMILNTMIVLVSLCLVILMGAHEMSLSVYMLFIVIEYMTVMAMNAAFREAARRCLVRKGQFGENSRYYKTVHLETLMKDLEQMKEAEFEYFVRDLLKLNDYKVKKLQKGEEYGVNLMAVKEKKKTLVKIKHMKDCKGQTDQSAVCQVVGAEAVFKAGGAMIVTNGSFTEQAIRQAFHNHTRLIDGSQLENILREKVTNSKDKNKVPEMIKES